MTKRETGILVIVLGIITAFIGLLVLEAGISLDMEYGGGAADKYVLIGIIVGALGAFGIVFGIRLKRNSVGDKESRYQEALKCISYTELEKLKKERDEGMITEEQFKQLVVQKSRKKV